MRFTIYVIMSDPEKPNYWDCPKIFKYRKCAVKFRNRYYPSFRVVKFTMGS